MTRILSMLVAALPFAGAAMSQEAPQAPAPTLELGMAQFREGDLASAVVTLDAVVRQLAAEPTSHGKELTQAYLYQGAAFVGLAQEESAKKSFVAALQYDKDLRITEEAFAPRVVRVFEAARAGKTKSVLLPPTSTGKKAGIGALGIAGIVAGVALAGGGIAAAASSSSPATDASVTPKMTFVSSSPSPGSTVATGPGLAVPLTMTVSVVYHTEMRGDGEVSVLLMRSVTGPTCASGFVRGLSLTPGVALAVTIAFRYSDVGACPLPAASAIAKLSLSQSGGAFLHQEDVALSYAFVQQ